MKFALQNYVSRALSPNQPRQTRAPAPGRHQTKRDSGKADSACRIIRCHAPVTCKSDLISAACAGTVNGSHSWNLQRGDAVKHALTFGNESAQLIALRVFEKRPEVGTGNEDRLLGRGD